MKIAGIIAEYNPFHNGHAHHIQRTRALTGCDYVVVCMDGHFTQRGEPAYMSKWTRAKMALLCGADAVVELPALFAVRTADAFARGGVGILGGIGVDVLSFGCEQPNLDVLHALADIRDQEPPEIADLVRQNLNAGKSHARAYGEAVAARLGMDAAALNRPNLALGVEYLRALKALFPQVEPIAVQRKGDYHDPSLGEFASASAIRAAFYRGDVSGALRAIPEAARPLAIPEALHAADDILMYRLRNMPLAEMSTLPGAIEGLDHRLFRLCRETATTEALINAMKCRRYTRARLNRLLTHALLGMTQPMLDESPVPTYARLISMRQDAAPLLRELSARTQLPIVTAATSLQGDPCFELECRATDLWALLHNDPRLRLPGREFTEPFVKV